MNKTDLPLTRPPLSKPLAIPLKWEDLNARAGNSLDLVRRLHGEAYLSFLDSAAQSEQLGRYSFITCDPIGIFKVTNGRASWNDEPVAGHPFVALQSLLSQYQQDSHEKMPPFQGGALGYLSYEAGRMLEDLPTTENEDTRLNDIILPFFDWVLAINHQTNHFDSDDTTQPLTLFSTGFAASTKTACPQRAKERAESTIQKLKRPTPDANIYPTVNGWRSNFTRQKFEQALERTKDYILAGDIFQANITQRFSAPRRSDAAPLDFYGQLRQQNAAPFAAYLDYGDHIIASSSPERFITLDKTGYVETRPIKGTAPRDLNNPAHDTKLADELSTSDKDRAENVMITDLMRNDISRICKAGTVKVPALCALESYARVHHLVSTVTATLKPDMNAISLLGASFPGGSITGAPKIRAMEIITELENLPRNVYCGSIGYIGFDGAMDTNIAIRTVTFTQDEIHFNVGGGITALSAPSEEYEECLHKARAIFHAFGTSIEAERENLEQANSHTNEESTE